MTLVSLPSRAGGERDALLGARAVADRAEHLRARQRDLHGAVRQLRGHRGERDVRPRRALRTEPAADEARDDAHVLGGQAEHRSELAARADHALRRVVEGEPVALPQRDGGVRLHRVVVLDGRRVHVVDLGRGARERGFGVALVRVGVLAVHLRRLVRRCVGEPRLGRGGGVADAQCRRSRRSRVRTCRPRRPRPAGGRSTPDRPAARAAPGSRLAVRWCSRAARWYASSPRRRPACAEPRRRRSTRCGHCRRCSSRARRTRRSERRPRRSTSRRR